MIEALQREEGKKRTLAQQLTDLDAIKETVSLDEKRLTKRILGGLGNLPALFDADASETLGRRHSGESICSGEQVETINGRPPLFGSFQITADGLPSSCE